MLYCCRKTVPENYAELSYILSELLWCFFIKKHWIIYFPIFGESQSHDSLWKRFGSRVQRERLRSCMQRELAILVSVDHRIIKGIFLRHINFTFNFFSDNFTNARAWLRFLEFYSNVSVRRTFLWFNNNRFWILTQGECRSSNFTRVPRGGQMKDPWNEVDQNKNPVCCYTKQSLFGNISILNFGKQHSVIASSWMKTCVTGRVSANLACEQTLYLGLTRD